MAGPMVIAVDAMGGDAAPDAVVRGALQASTRTNARILLVGNEKRLHRCLAFEKHSPAVDVLHAPDTVDMGDLGPLALRKKKLSSLYVAMDQLQRGAADAVVSAGNSAAIVATASHHLGLIPGLKRPALGVLLPSFGPDLLLADAGAHSESGSIHLAQTVFLAVSFLKHACGRPHPSIGILNIGHEPTKGPRTIQGAMKLLAETSTPAVRYVEPHTLFHGTVDGVVCDGFVGNALLKLLEGVSDAARQCMEAYGDGILEPSSNREASSLEPWLHRLAFKELGAAPLLGVRKTVLIAHGRSRAREIANAILEAESYVRQELSPRMAKDEELLENLAAVRSHYTRWMLAGLKGPWRFSTKKPESDKGGQP
ncbi:phosphate acyltransferase [Desulfosoma sp.]|uniref:phosphate acyltransferase n=1 Tax=Desulfosoma sp. TaxID=2603217 RepID=UPI0040492A36